MGPIDMAVVCRTRADVGSGSRREGWDKRPTLEGTWGFGG